MSSRSPKSSKSGSLESIRNHRTLFLLIVSIILLAAVLVRVGYIKVVHGEEYETKAEAQQLNSTDVVIPALRGSIYDRNGNLLAESVRVYNVILDPQTLIDADEASQTSTVDQLVSILGLSDESVIRQYLDSKYYSYRYLKLPEGEGISTETMQSIQEGIDDGSIAGVWFEEAEQRNYPNDSLACHVIGFNGNYGVEEYYDEYLTGTDGRKMVVAGTGNSFVEEYVAPEDGDNLVLAIDSKVQYLIEQTLAEGVKETNARRGIAIAMNCKTGEILGYACVPSYNLNDVTEVYGATETFYNYYPTTSEDFNAQVWYNWGIQMPFDPGSIFKPVFAAAAYNEGLFSTDEIFVCNGYIQIYDAEVDELYLQAHGSQTFDQVMENSCNVALSTISLRMTEEKWLQYQDAFGLGELTGIDLAGEEGDNRDLIYLSEEEAERRGTTNVLGPYEKATISFGQGFKLTPIQMISAFNSVINGGEYLKPYVVSQITDSNGNVVKENSKTVLRHTVSEDTCKVIRKSLEAVVRNGTGATAQIPGYYIGGKTGTGQQVNSSGTYDEVSYIVSFISCVPLDDPEVILMVSLQDTEHSNSHEAAHLNAQIMEKILPNLGIYPDPRIYYKSVSPNATPVTDSSTAYYYGTDSIFSSDISVDDSSSSTTSEETQTDTTQTDTTESDSTPSSDYQLTD